MKLHEMRHRREVGAVLTEMRLFDFGVEIGVAYAENAEAILRSSRLRTLFLVDPWRALPADEYIDGSSALNFDACFGEAMRRMANPEFVGRVAVLRMKSDQAADLFRPEQLDFVYIDGNHHESQVSRDILRWWGLVKVGGLIGGHDYYDCDQPATAERPRYLCQVKSAVDRFRERHEKRIAAWHTTMHPDCDASWWMVKGA